MSTRTKKAQPERGRYDELKNILESRRRELTAEVRSKMKHVRAENSDEAQGVLDAAETSEADIQDDIEFALIQMKKPPSGLLISTSVPSSTSHRPFSIASRFDR